MPNSTPSSGDWSRLARYVVSRRQELGLSQAEAARLAQLGARNTWIKIEKGVSATRDSKWAGIENALAWERGSVQSVLNGGEPVAAESVRNEDEDEDPAGVIRDTVNRSDWDEGTKRALLAIVDDAEARLAELKKDRNGMHNSRPTV